MKLLFFLGHPAHFHLFKNIIKILIKNNHKITIVIKEKDILKDLIENSNFEYINILKNKYERHAHNKFNILFLSFLDLIKKDYKLFKIISREKVDLLIGTEASISHIGRLFNIPSIILNEDDITINPEFCYPTYPFANYIISPIVCSVGFWKYKKISYNGYQKLAYLHPNYFQPDIEIVRSFNPELKKYALLRFINPTASHDAIFSNNRISFDNINQLILYLKKYYTVYITSEQNLPQCIREYKLNINPADIHHVLYYADLFVSDSQSMTVESAIIGTPSLRYNDFVGKISVLEELEKEYHLTIGVKPPNFESIFFEIENILKNRDSKTIFIGRKKKMLSEKIDITRFLVWFIENFPGSAERMKENPDYQYNFL